MFVDHLQKPDALKLKSSKRSSFGDIEFKMIHLNELCIGHTFVSSDK